ncbi:MAG: hypothetical protein D6743_16245 [Calditrichaeota bacterium]|nr:MAG: hypothetical protein D6743_16245 [Calditrichota bacterium]
MTRRFIEKRKFPRLDTSNCEAWKIRVFGVRGKPLEGQILNLSLGGVAFVTDWRNVLKTINRFKTRVEIELPDGKHIDAASFFLRAQPKRTGDDCICVLALIGLEGKNSTYLQQFISGKSST